ncbi:FimV/HubP family polar landmark protein, partial [Neisseria bacilliformis]
EPQQPEPAGWQGDDSDVDLTSSVTFDDTQLDTADDLNIDWGSLEAADEGGDSKPAFVSESVGMTAPLEAKYELAEMYIEIGDPDAARETLYELIDESHGEIQAKSKELLARIGG